MNLPNLLTILRIFFVPLLVAVLVADKRSLDLGTFAVSNDLLALGIFLAAAVTDLLDGYLARRWRQVTTVGTLLDPIADKLLISAALVSLVEMQRVPAWMVILIVGREFAVSGFVDTNLLLQDLGIVTHGGILLSDSLQFTPKGTLLTFESHPQIVLFAIALLEDRQFLGQLSNLSLVNAAFVAHQQLAVTESRGHSHPQGQYPRQNCLQQQVSHHSRTS